MLASLIPTKDNPHPLLKLEGEERKRFTYKSLSITIFVTLTLYILPSYLSLERLTTESAYFALDLFGFRPRLFTYEDSLTLLTGIDRFLYYLYDPTRATYPAISIDAVGSRSNFLIVRACTGMQAGALLLGLIWSTPAKLHDRIRSSYVVLLALFIGNTLRIAAMIAITTMLMQIFGLDYYHAWHNAHDILGRPIGFFGTIAFTMLIEARNVKILDTITVWIDTFTKAKPKSKPSSE